jgi:hypothetical protein
MASLTIAIVTINPKISGAGQGAKTNEHSEKTTVTRIAICYRPVLKCQAFMDRMERGFSNSLWGSKATIATAGCGAMGVGLGA